MPRGVKKPQPHLLFINLELISIYHLTFFTLKIGVLHGLLQRINSFCSFKFLMMGFNPSLTLGFTGYCFWYGNRWGSLSLTRIETVFCAQPTVFPSVHTLGFTFCSNNGREQAPHYENRGLDLAQYILPRKHEGETLAQSETREKQYRVPVAA